MNTTQTTIDPVIATDNRDLEKTLEAVRLGTQKAESTQFGFGQSTRRINQEFARFFLGIRRLDKTLGGIGRKESVLFAGAQSSGKTVMACQFAAALAATGLQTLLISTDQPHERLEPRITSNLCSIPFDRISDGVRPELLSRPEVEKYECWERRIEKKLHFADWMDGQAVTMDLERLVVEVKREHGLDVIVLDCIAGALGATTASTFYPRLYQDAGDAFCDVVTRHNLIGLAFAHTGVIQGRNKPRVDASCLAECKTLHRKFTTAIGISLLDKAIGDYKVEGIYAHRQYFHVFKGRRVGAVVPFRRDFDFQRAVDTD